MIGTKEKNKLYLELWDAFHRKGCPVCGCIDERVTRGIRETLGGEAAEKAVPLCPSHTRVLAAEGDERGRVAVLRFIRQVEAGIRNMLDRRGSRPGTLGIVKTVFTGRREPQWETSSSKCPACRLHRQQERKALAVLADALTDPDFHRAFRESDGLCLLHLVAFSRRFLGKAAAGTVLREQLGKIEELRDAFTPFRFQPDRAGYPDDPAAWQKVLLLLGRVPERGRDPEAVFIPESGDGAISPSDVPVADDPERGGAGGEDERFEQARWLRARDALQKRLSEERSRAAALHYRYWKAMEDNKTLQMNLAGAQALARSLQEQIDRLKAEISMPESQGSSTRAEGH